MKLFHPFCAFVVIFVSISCLACPPVNPTIDVQVSTNTPSVGQTVTFDADETVCADSGTLEYTWVFPPQAYQIYIYGDNGEYAQCKFSPAGSYDVNLKVTNLSTDMQGQWQTLADQSATCDDDTINVSAYTSGWYVSVDGDDDNNGQSWANAFEHIQTAIDSACDGDEILVASGDGSTPAVYYEQLDMKGKSVYIHSADPDSELSDWELAENTILDAQMRGSAVLYRGNENAAEGGSLEGITITGGYPAGDGLALHLELDETAGTTAADSSGKGRNGTLNFTGDPNWIDEGYIDGALEFDGDDYVEIEGYKGVVGQGARTCAAWINTTSSVNSIIMSWGDEDTGGKWMFFISSAGKLRVGVWGGYIEGNTGGINDGTWHHVAAVLEDDDSPSLDEIKLYVDGIQQVTACYGYSGYPPRINTGATVGVTVGARFAEGLSTVYLDGVLDDVHVYSRALANSEIRELAKVEYPVSYFKMDSQVTGVILDEMNNNDGILEGDASINSSDYQSGTGSVQFSGAGYADLGSFNYIKGYCSIALWFKTSTANAWLFDSAEVPGSKSPTGVNDWTDLYLDSNGYLVFRFQCGNNDIVARSNVDYADGLWHHVVAEKVGSYTAKIYVDGVLKDSETSTGGGSGVDAPSAVNVGRQTDGTGYFSGLIDELQIYKRCLSDSEIAQMYGIDNLQGHWKLDGDPDDYSGNGLDGIIYSYPGTVDGYLGQALDFDGIDDYVEIDDYSGVTGDNPRTSCAWFKTTSNGSVLLSWGDSVKGEAWFIVVDVDGTLAGNVWQGHIHGSTVVNDGLWHHVALVLGEDLNGDGRLWIQDLQLYLDGRLETTTLVDNTGDPSASINTSNDLDVTIGVRNYASHPTLNYAYYFDGSIDEVRVYDRALTGTEINELANKTPKLLAQWTFDDNCDDASGNGHHGIEPNNILYRDGMVGKSVSFNGQDQRVIVPHSPQLKPQLPITLSAWVNLNTSGTNGVIIKTDYSTYQYAYSGVYLGLDYTGSDKVFLGYGDGTSASPTGRGTKVGTTVLRPGQWYHVVGVIRDAQDMSIYIDGVDDGGGYTGTSTRPIFYEGNDTVIGCGWDSGTNTPDRYFAGQIDDVRVYNYGLAVSEVQTVYQSRFAEGGGLKGHGALVDLSQCIIDNNTSQTNGGGAEYFYGTSENVLFTNNKASGYGGGVMGGGELINCTIANNTASQGGGLYDCNDIILNSIIWDNGLNPLVQCSVPYYSDIQYWASGGTGNMSYEPNFINPIICDYHLDPNSSLCIDAGNPYSDYAQEPMPNGSRINMGAYGNTPEAAITIDTDGDGLGDSLEIREGLDPEDSDSDDDGLTDYEELMVYGTDALDSDTDNDGMPDGWEVDNGIYPTYGGDATMDYDGDGLTNLEEFQAGTNPHSKDSDDDGMPDVWETQWNLDPTDPNDADLDMDTDTYSNVIEYWHGGDPNDPNTLTPRKFVVPTDVNSIQQAVDWSINGDEIEVLPGEYNEAVTVEGKAIYLHGSDPDNWDVVKSTSITGGQTCLLLRYNDPNMLVEGITISSGYYGVRWDNSQAKMRRCVVNNNTIGSHCLNSDCVITQNYIYGNSIAIVPLLSNSIIHSNILFMNDYGIIISYSDGASILNNTITANDYGILVMNGQQPHDISNNILYYNNILDLINCSVSYSCVGDGDAGVGNISSDPNFVNTFNHFEKTLAGGTQNTVFVAEPNLYAIDDVIEYENDGVVRTVTDLNVITGAVTFDVPLEANSTSGAVLFNWGIAATDLEEDFHLKPTSPCINAGDPNITSDPNGFYYGDVDIDGEARIRGNYVDMGADESPVIWYVDDDANGLETGYTWTDAFNSIQAAIEIADDEDVVLVDQGQYNENIHIQKELQVVSASPNNWSSIESTIISASDPNYAVISLYTSSASIVGFTVQGGAAGIGVFPSINPVIDSCRITQNGDGVYCDYGAPQITNSRIIGNTGVGVHVDVGAALLSNTIVAKNLSGGILGNTLIESCTVVDNTEYGVQNNSEIITNSILWDNDSTDLLGAYAEYSCIQSESTKGTNFSYYPYFVNAGANDYHLLNYSPCIDAGDPNSLYSNELNDAGFRINLGAYGNTLEATLASGDVDLDLLPDTWEALYWSVNDPNGSSDDFDNDFLTNLTEYHIGTNPSDIDTDNDSIPDYWEYMTHLDPLDLNDADEDRDQDGLNELQEYQNFTNPLSSDSDSDGLPDAWEVQYQLDAMTPNAYEDPDQDGLTNIQEYELGSDPTDSDSDNDGLPDGWEVENNLDLLNASDASLDPDSDGLTNLQEYQAGTSISQTDTDGDGMSDAWEENHGLNPLDEDDDISDLDDDGYSNYVEYLHNGDPNDGDPNAVFENITIAVPTFASTIQQGVDWSLDGDTVQIYPGIYNETVIVGGKTITLTGIETTGWERIANTVIDASDLEYGIVLDANDLGSTIQYLTVSNASTGIYSVTDASPVIKQVIVESTSQAAIRCDAGMPTIQNCMLGLNSGDGVLLAGVQDAVIKNTCIYNNSGDAIDIQSSESSIEIRNNTIVSNGENGVLYAGDANDMPEIRNCILWDNASNDLNNCMSDYCYISEEEIDEPSFISPGYPDYNYQIDRDSPCIDAGDPNSVYENEADLFGQIRSAGRIDIGADEVCTIYNMTQDIWYNDPNETIQEAINNANDFDVIELYEWVYSENINFNGKKVNLQSTNSSDWTVIEYTIIQAEDPNAPVITFDSGEDANSVVSGLTIRDALNVSGIVCDNNSSPTIKRNLIRDNFNGIYCTSGAPQIINNKIGYNWGDGGTGIVTESPVPPTIIGNVIFQNDNGIAYLSAVSQGKIYNNTIANNFSIDPNYMGVGIYVDANSVSPDIANCILWANDDDLDGASAKYSCIESVEDANGINNITDDPIFISIENDNYHIACESLCQTIGDPDRVDGFYDIDGQPIAMTSAEKGIELEESILYAAAGTDGGVTRYVGAWDKDSNVYTSLQSAIIESADGDTIWVAEGTYRPDVTDDNPEGTNEPTVSFVMKDSLQLYGGFFGDEILLDDRDPEKYPTKLSGALADNIRSNCILDCSNVNTVRIDGFEIINGLATTHNSGAALSLSSSEVTLENCNINSNDSTHHSVYGIASALTVNNCVFQDYSGGIRLDGYDAAYGPGISELNISNSKFINDQVVSHVFSSGTNIENCYFEESNISLSFTIGSLDIKNCIFVHCITPLFFERGGLLSVTNSAFFENQGHAIYSFRGNLDVTNCTFYNNSSTSGGGGIFYPLSYIIVKNSIFWENTGGATILESQIYPYGPTVNAQYCCIQDDDPDDGTIPFDEYGTNHNIDDNPHFIDPVNYVGPDGIEGTPDDGLRLDSGSPCLDAGDDTAANNAGITLDITGRDRFQGTVDMGAYEGGRPVAENIEVHATQNKTLTIEMDDQDSEGYDLTYMIATIPYHGTVKLVDGDFEYVPDTDYTCDQSHPDTFTYCVSNGTVFSMPGKISIIIDPDFDGDGLSDPDEITAGTDNGVKDSDHDGFWDGWEVDNGYDPDDNSSFPGTGGDDYDQDGLSNLDEITAGTNAADPDTDDDGMPDGWEYTYGLDPVSADDKDADPDDDEMTNLEEYQYSVDYDPTLVQSLNPKDKFTDEDGLPDGWEVKYGLDPLSTASPNGDNDGADDGQLDNDGLTNLEEFQNNCDPTKTNTDGDLLDDVKEVKSWSKQYGSYPDIFIYTYPNNYSDPSTPDTDGDGLIDSYYESYIPIAPKLSTFYDLRVSDAGFSSSDYPGLAISDGYYIGDNDLDNAYYSEDHYPHNIFSRDPLAWEDDLWVNAWEVKYTVKHGGLNWSTFSRQDFLDCTLQGSTNIIDSDGDGLSDYYEMLLDSDPFDPDEDDDNLPDGDEYETEAQYDGGCITSVDFTPITDPENADTDGDDRLDGDEINGEYGYFTEPLNFDTDGDLLPDGWEVDNGMDPTYDDRIGLFGAEATRNTDQMAPVPNEKIVPGKIGNGLYFDGQSRYIEGSNSSTLDFVGPYAISFWVKPDNLTGTKYLLCKDNGTNGFNVRLEGNKVVVTVRINGTEYTKASKGNVSTNWNHIFVARGTTHLDILINSEITQDVYFDKPSSGYYLYVGSNNSYSGTPLLVGVNREKNGNFFQGSMDNIIFVKNQTLISFSYYSGRYHNTSVARMLYNNNAGTENLSVDPTIDNYTQLFWRMNEDDISEGTAENYLDVYDVKNNNHGKFYFDPKDSGFYVFNGSDYISAQTDSALSDLRNVSWGGWFNFQVSGTSAGLVLGKDSGGVSFGLARDGASNKLRAYVGDSYVESDWQPASGSAYGIIDDTNWHYAMAVYDGTQATNSDRLKLYLDGNPVQTEAYGSAFPDSLILQGLQVGGNDESAIFNQHLGGVDNVSVHSKSLNSTDISNMYNNGLGTESLEQDDLLAHYKMNEAGASASVRSDAQYNYNDSDNDGLDDFDEYRWGTDPESGDTDGDGDSDADEIANDKDPTNPEDLATVKVKLSVGDQSGSHSEQYVLHCGERNQESRSWGEMGYGEYTFSAGKSYKIRISHLGTSPEQKEKYGEPDFDYTAAVELVGDLPDGVEFKIEDPYDPPLLATNGDGSPTTKPLYATGKTALLEIRLNGEIDEIVDNPNDPNNPYAYRPADLDPVNLDTGAYTLHARDVLIKGRALDVSMERYYLSNSRYNGPFGYGWDFSYNIFLERSIKDLEITDIILYGGGHTTYRYYADPENPNMFYHQAIKDEYVVYDPGTGTFTLYKVGGIRYKFNANDRIEEICDRHQNSIRFDYYTAGQDADFLTKVIDDLGRETRLVYSDLLLKRIIDYSGRIWEYTYDANRNLRSVTGPATPDYPDGLTVEYGYEGDDTPLDSADDTHNLTTVTDPAGQKYIENIYTNQQVTTQTYGEHDFTSFYDPGQNRTIVTDRKGNKSIYYYDDNRNQTAKAVFKDDTETDYYLTSYEYDDSQQLTKITYPRGNWSEYEYDDNGNVTGVNEYPVPGSAEDLAGEIISAAYEYQSETGFTDLVDSVTDPLGVTTDYTYDFELPTNDPQYGTNGDLVKITYPQVDVEGTLKNPQTEFEYDDFGRVTKVSLVELLPDGSTTEDSAVAIDYDDGLMGHWRLENNVSAGSATVMDCSVNKNHGIPTNNMRAVSGKNGKALEFNSINDSITIGDSYDYTAYTFAAWVKPVSTDAQSIIVLTDVGGSLYSHQLRINASGQFEHYLRLEDGSTRTVTNTTQISAGQWYHVAIVVEKDSPDVNMVRLYVNGAEEPGTAVSLSGTLWSGNTRCLIGQSMGGFGFFNGTIDDVRVYSKDLNSEVISAIADENRRLDRTVAVIVDPDGEAITTWYDYDVLGNLISTTDPEGRLSQMYYNDLQQLISTVSSVGSQTDFYYNKNKKVEWIKSQFGTSYDPEDPTTYQQVDYAYNILDKLTKVTDPMGYETNIEYDKNDNVSKVIDEEGKGSYSYPTVGPDYSTNYDYDARDLPKTTTDALSHVTENFYDDNGNLIKVKDAEGNDTIYEYDGFDRLVKTTYADNTYETYQYDDAGNVTQYTSRAGDTFTYEYDALGRMTTRRIEPDPIVLGTELISNGMFNTDLSGWTHDMYWGFETYGPYGGTVRSNMTGQNTSLSQSIAIQPGRSYLISYEIISTTSLTLCEFTLGGTVFYSGFGYEHTEGTREIIVVAGSDNDEIVFNINDSPPLGAAFRMDNVSVREINPPTKYKYDIAGRLLEIEDNGDSTSPEVQVAYDDLKRPEIITDENGHEVAYAYHPDGRVAKVTQYDQQQGDLDVYYQYDDLGRLQYIHMAVWDENNTPQILAKYEYDELSRRTHVYYNYNYTSDNDDSDDPTYDGSMTYTYTDSEREDLTTSYPDNDLGHWLDKIESDVDNDTNIDISYDYGYDNVGNRTSVIDNAGPTDYDYDNVYQLTQANYAEPSLADIASITYDAVYNRDEFDNGSTIEYTANALNQYTNLDPYNYELTYDDNGNLIYNAYTECSYSYDAENRMTRVYEDYNYNHIYDGVDINIATYTYDSFGQRISKYVEDTDVTTTYVYDGPQVIAEYEDTGTGPVLARRFIYGPGIDEPVAMIVLTGVNQGVYFYYYDGLGSVAALSNTSGTIVEGYTYDAFGAVKIHTSAGTDTIWLNGDTGTTYDTSSTGSPKGNPYMFTGRRLDPETRTAWRNGLYYYRARMYNPGLGRFMQTDPIGYADSMNLYQYCGNNPVNWIDPWGLAASSLENGGPAGAEEIATHEGLAKEVTKSPWKRFWNNAKNYFKNGAKARRLKKLNKARELYEKKVKKLADAAKKMKDSGKNCKETAEKLFKMRQKLKDKFLKNVPDKVKETIRKRQLERYGNPDGPTIDWLLENGRTYQDIIDSACRPGGQDLKWILDAATTIL